MTDVDKTLELTQFLCTLSPYFSMHFIVFLQFYVKVSDLFYAQAISTVLNR